MAEARVCAELRYCKKVGLPAFLQVFLRRIYSESITAVEHAGQVRSHFAMAKGGSQGRPASGFLSAMAFDPIFKCLVEEIIPKDLSVADFLQPTACANTNDFAVVAPSFRKLMPAVAPAFRTFDEVTGMEVNHKKGCWVQCGDSYMPGPDSMDGDEQSLFS